MTLSEKIFATLTADAAVLTALGSPTAAPYPVFAMRAPIGQAGPFIVYFTVTSTAEPTHDDGSGVDSRLLQFSCYAPTYLAAVALRRAARAALKDLKLDDGGALTIEGERDLFDPAVDYHHCILEVHAVHDALA